MSDVAMGKRKSADAPSGSRVTEPLRPRLDTRQTMEDSGGLVPAAHAMPLEEHNMKPSSRVRAVLMSQGERRAKSDRPGKQSTSPY